MSEDNGLEQQDKPVEEAEDSAPVEDGAFEPPAGEQQMEIMGLIALICGALAFPLGFCCGIFAAPLPLAAIVLGIVSFLKCKNNPGQFKLTWMGPVGIALGVLSVGFVIVITVLSVGMNLMASKN